MRCTCFRFRHAYNLAEAIDTVGHATRTAESPKIRPPTARWVTEVKLGEPDPKMFKVPDGYRLLTRHEIHAEMKKWQEANK